MRVCGGGVCVRGNIYTSIRICGIRWVTNKVGEKRIGDMISNTGHSLFTLNLFHLEIH